MVAPEPGDGDRSRPRYPFLDHPFPIPFAHRGGSGEHPENTAAAFQAAVDLGYRYLETDVHATSDGTLVAFHDHDLTRTCGIPKQVGELTWSEVAAARVGGREPIPRLEEILGSWPDARVNIDVKHPSAIEPLIRVVERTASVDRVCVGSFSSKRVAAVRARLGPRLCTSAGMAEVAGLRARSYGRAATTTTTSPPRRRAGTRAAAAQVPIRSGRIPVIDRRFVDFAHRRGLHVHAWTINTGPEIEALLDLGVDGIMSDDLVLLKQALVARGLWA